MNIVQDKKRIIISEINKNINKFQISSPTNQMSYDVEGEKCEINFDEINSGIFSLRMYNENDEAIKVDVDKIENNEVIVEEDMYFYPYITQNGNLRILNHVDKLVNNSKIIFKKMYVKKDIIVIKYNFKSYNYTQKLKSVEIRNRDSSKQHFLEINEREILIDCSLFTNGTYDFYATTLVGDVDVTERIFTPRLRQELVFPNPIINTEKSTYYIKPYRTYKKHYFSLIVSKVENVQKTDKELKDILKISNLNKVILVGEKREKAEDNGLAFFKRARELFPDLDIFYVLDESAVAFDRVSALGNVIKFGSPEHFYLYKNCTDIVCTHHPEFIIPVNHRTLDKRLKKIQITFIQHGVLGTKNLTKLYGNYVSEFKADHFIVSSDYEKSYIASDLGYPIDNIHVTGLARFDYLFEKDYIIDNKSILIMPTWREWIQSRTEEEFKKTEYYLNWNKLINAIKEKYTDYNITLFLHVNMKNYINAFDISSITCLEYGDEDIQSLLKRHKLLITDYSSIGFDFSFLDKMVIYFQFDQKQFFRLGSHIRYEEELPGKVLSTSEDIIDYLDKHARDDFDQTIEMRNKSSKFIKYRDQNNTKRIIDVLKKEKKKIKHRNIYKNLFILKNLISNSSFYMILMKKYNKYNIAKIDKNMVFLENNLGRDLGDSPFEIYSQWKFQDNNIKFIYVNNRLSGLKMGNTRYIKRLSIEYFYYHSKARILINNQNFPLYFRKKKGQIYLQTWHGTPLKKMFNDLDNIVGRDDNYLKNANRQFKSWNYLLSESEYTTEKFSSAFKYNSKILEVGFPRTEMIRRNYNDSELKQKLLSSYNIPKDKKVILYAPTFRDYEDKIKNKFISNFFIDLEKFSELSSEYVLLVKPHLIMDFKEDISIYDFIRIAKNDSIEKLYSIADILITDYSSVFFDYLKISSNIIFYLPDYNKYVNEERGLYIDLKNELPFAKAYDTEQLIDVIKLENYINVNSTEFKKYYSTYDITNPSEIIIKELQKYLK